MNIQASVLSHIERGETKSVSHDLVIKFAEYYNVSTHYLLCISDIRIRRNVELEELGLITSRNFLIQFLPKSVVVVLWNLEMPTAQGAHAWAPFLQLKNG